MELQVIIEPPALAYLERKEPSRSLTLMLAERPRGL